VPDGPLKIVLLTSDGREREFTITVARALELFRENAFALRYEGWPEEAFSVDAV
jgi:hypothetical protein